MTPVKSPTPSDAFDAGVAATQDWWRSFVISTATDLAGGERGMLATRRNGRCEREPQQSLELLIERATTIECRIDHFTDAAPPTTELLRLLALLARTPDFTPIHLKRPQLNILLAGVRALQDHARNAISSIDALGKLNYQDLHTNEVGPAITFLSSIRDSLKELLK